MRYLILAQSKPTAHALGAWLELLGERPIEKLDDDQRVIVWAGRDGLPVAQAFERLFRALEAAAYGGGGDAFSSTGGSVGRWSTASG